MCPQPSPTELVHLPGHNKELCPRKEEGQGGLAETVNVNDAETQAERERQAQLASILKTPGLSGNSSFSHL